MIVISNVKNIPCTVYALYMVECFYLPLMPDFMTPYQIFVVLLFLW